MSRFETTITMLLADISDWQAKIGDTIALIERLKAHPSADVQVAVPSAAEETPKPKRKRRKPGRPAGRPKKGTQNSAEPIEPWVTAGVSRTTWFRQQRKAAATLETPSPASLPQEPPPPGWHYDEHGNLTREHVAVPENPLPEGERLRRDAEKHRRRGNADATA